MKQSANNVFSKESQNELKVLWRKGIEDVWKGDSSMVEWEMKQLTYIIPICGGKYMIELTKPSITTEFWFGESDCGQGPSHDENNVNMNTVRFMIEDYFMDYNLKSIDKMINNLKDIINGKTEMKAQHYIHYYGCPENSPIHGLCFWDPWHGNSVSGESWDLDKNDVELVLKAYELQRERFVKRLEGYLKKYGAKKLRVCSYWIDR